MKYEYALNANPLIGIKKRETKRLRTQEIPESGIYMIFNIVNGKYYIGSSINLKKRIKNHELNLKKNKHDNKYLQRSWNKYGEGNFRIIILMEIKIKENLIKKEQHYIDSFHSHCKKLGFNIHPKAGSPLGYKHNPNSEVFSKSFKIKMSIVTAGEKNGMYNKNHSEKSKRKMSEVKKERGNSKGKNNVMYGRNHSEETKEKIRKTRKEKGLDKSSNNPMYGRKHSEESKKKMSETRKANSLRKKQNEKN